MQATTCACRSVIFINEENLFLDAVKFLIVQSRRQYFTWKLFDIVTKQLLHLLFFSKSVRGPNLVSASSSHVEPLACVSTRYW